MFSELIKRYYNRVFAVAVSFNGLTIYQAFVVVFGIAHLVKMPYIFYERSLWGCISNKIFIPKVRAESEL